MIDPETLGPPPIRPLIRPLGRIVPAAEAGLWRNAAEAVATLERNAALDRDRAAASLAADRDALRRAMEQETALHTARALAEAAAAAQRALQAMSADIAATIAAAVRKVIGEIPLPEAVAAAAAEAMKDLASRHGVTIHVHPACAAGVRATLLPWGEGARVVADESLPPDACTLETELGIVRAGLSDQLAILESTLGQAALSHA